MVLTSDYVEITNDLKDKIKLLEAELYKKTIEFKHVKGTVEELVLCCADLRAALNTDNEPFSICDEIDKIIDCEICGHCYGGDKCRYCYLNNTSHHEWQKIPDNFDMPSFAPFLIYTPHHDTNILTVCFCDSDRRFCHDLHIEMVDAMGMGESKYFDIPIDKCTHWMKLPEPPKDE